MPSASEARKRGGVTKVQTKKLPDGTLVHIYVYRKKKGTTPKKASQSGKAK